MVSASYTLLQIGGLLFVIQLAHKYRANVIACVGLCEGAMQLGVLVGNLTGQSFAPYVATPGAMAMAMLLLCGVFSLSWIMFPTDRRRRPDHPALVEDSRLRLARSARSVTTAGSKDIAVGGSASSADGSTSGASVLREDAFSCDEGEISASIGEAGAMLGASPDHRLDSACQRLAAQGGLSARETEILQYLARGRSQPYIRDELVLSKNTVATHVKHIYQKLEVHSRQELLDLVERASRE